jgi:hypothetical protein
MAEARPQTPAARPALLTSNETGPAGKAIIFCCAAKTFAISGDMPGKLAKGFLATKTMLSGVVRPATIRKTEMMTTPTAASPSNFGRASVAGAGT